jgi:hypothetical protein
MCGLWWLLLCGIPQRCPERLHSSSVQPPPASACFLNGISYLSPQRIVLGQWSSSPETGAWSTGSFGDIFPASTSSLHPRWLVQGYKSPASLPACVWSSLRHVCDQLLKHESLSRAPSDIRLSGNLIPSGSK